MDVFLMILLLVMLSTEYSYGIEPSRKYKKPVKLGENDNCDLYWSYRRKKGGRVKFELICKTTESYLAIGVSPNGTMANSDIVTAYIKDGQELHQDRFAASRSLPVAEDPDQNDWKLHNITEEDGETRMIVSRKLKKGQEGKDHDINCGNITLCWAYGGLPTDATTNIQQHSTSNRGVVDVTLFKCRKKNKKKKKKKGKKQKKKKKKPKKRSIKEKAKKKSK